MLDMYQNLKIILFPLGILDSGVYRFAGKGGTLKVCKDILVVMKTTKIGNLYKLKGRTQVIEVVVLSKEANAYTHLWNQPLGYMSKEGLRLQILVNCKLFP
jgi:hypothetical protein